MSGTGLDVDLYLDGVVSVLIRVSQSQEGKFGVKLAESRIYSDSAPIIMRLAQRGVIKLG